MARNNYGENFLELGLDWYLVECWNPATNESQLQQHLRLGSEYARLGHQGRRRFIRTAHTHHSSPPTSLPPHIFNIPSDLLTPHERRLNKTYTPIWIRTDYSSGTDLLHHNLVSSVPPNPLLNPHSLPSPILDNPTRYAFLATQPLQAILSFFPLLIEVTSDLYVQPDALIPWSSPDLQSQFLDKEQEADTEETKKHKRMIHQRSFFVADEEAMRTGYVLWVHMDQYGNVVQKNRVQPMLFGALGGADWAVSLGELGVGYEDGRLDAVRDEWGNLRPKLVRRSTNTQILDSLLALKTEQRFIA
ncbi:hypothetical protein NA56DRAFT_664047 [Hyaloscypha hepaticicola]|uniref:Uncharacterized protein n=1 Tax=Hyaloscypha hepaticicola TaxID=2082293 RepID=A0A2J6PMP2_9HELO|nr:hypothetical protein NA56DRAFT_664047 [Hyaloscypha hepaticicola]